MNKAEVKRTVLKAVDGSKYAGYAVKFNLTEEEFLALQNALWDHTTSIGNDLRSYLRNAIALMRNEK